MDSTLTTTATTTNTNTNTKYPTRQSSLKRLNPYARSFLPRFERMDFEWSVLLPTHRLFGSTNRYMINTRAQNKRPCSTMKSWNRQDKQLKPNHASISAGEKRHPRAKIAAQTRHYSPCFFILPLPRTSSDLGAEITHAKVIQASYLTLRYLSADLQPPTPSGR